ncbi:MAG: hypothetical protein COA79_20525 [Planctomycetota bacterium]|nr:MAG: hypothetical protein COA79_20525 [Planctomycetota bacterium]
MDDKISRGISSATLTNSVVEFIKSQIVEGHLKSGEFLVSERKLSQLIGVSRVTVRRGLELLINDKIIIKKYNQGYIYSGDSLDLLLKKQKAVLFLHQQEEKNLPFDNSMSSIWEGARLEAKENDLITMVKFGINKVSPKLAKDLSRISCAIVTDLIDRESIQNLINEKLIVVHLDNYAGSFVDNVLQDDFGGMIEGVEYLIKNKCKNISFFSTLNSFKEVGLELNSEVRLAAFKTVLDRYDLPILETTISEVNADGNDIEDFVNRILQASVDALVFPHNYLFDRVAHLIENNTNCDIPILVLGNSQVSPNLNLINIIWNTKSMGREAVKRIMYRLTYPTMDTIKILISCRVKNNSS